MRLDSYLVSKAIFASRTKARQSILKNEIFIDGKLYNKPSFNITENKEYNIERKFCEDFVSLGGFKLSKAIKDFNFNVDNFICADIGASTGGFTDCLLQNNAKKVYSIDLNSELLCDKLKKNNKVVPIIKNAKFLKKEDFNENLDLITADLSFISEKIILPIISSLLENETYAIILIKPQFELDKKIKVKNGILKDNKLIKTCCDSVIECAKQNSLELIDLTDAPLYKDKNHEFLALFKKFTV